MPRDADSDFAELNPLDDVDVSDQLIRKKEVGRVSRAGVGGVKERKRMRWGGWEEQELGMIEDEGGAGVYLARQCGDFTY